MANLTEEQAMLREMAHNWAAEKSPIGAFRKLRDSDSALGFDAAVYAQMAAMGWTGILVPEALGGSDFGILAIGLVLEETGRTLAASPLLATALAATSALTLGGNQSQKEKWLPSMATGDAIATLAVDEEARHNPTYVKTRATRSHYGYILDGEKLFVIEGMAADLLIVSARTSGPDTSADGISLFLVPANAAGVSRKPLKLIDSRGAATIQFTNVELDADALLGAESDGFGLLEKTLDRARAGIAAEMLGASSQAFDITIEYLKTRVQFGQPIGSFQALQHRAAKMFTELELSRSCVEAALIAIDADSDDVPELVSLAKAKMGDTAHLISNEMVQMHGGIGMTDAHDAGFYLKRARSLAALYGNQAFHRDRYGRLRGY